MNIYGEKVILRAVGIEDTDMLLTLINDPDTERMLGGNSFPVSKEAQQKWISGLADEKNILRCIISDRKSLEPGLGTIILSDIDMKNGNAQIHIKMAEERGRHKGYGTDALQTIVKYAFNEMRLNCVYAEILEYNIPSQKLFEKCGFYKEGIMRSRVYKDGSYVDVLLYSKLQKDY